MRPASLGCLEDAADRERLVEQLAGRADERLACEILAIARRLADQHQPRRDRALTEHRLRGVLVQRAAPARRDRRAQRRQRMPDRQASFRARNLVGRRLALRCACCPASGMTSEEARHVPPQAPVPSRFASMMSPRVHEEVP
jgi:hypothetical protein